MACRSTVTIICMFAALVGQALATSSNAATTTGEVSTTSAEATSTANQGTTTTTTMADQGTTTTGKVSTTSGDVTSTASQGTTTTTTIAEQGTTTTGKVSTTSAEATSTASQGTTTTTTDQVTTSETTTVGVTTTVTTTMYLHTYSGSLTLTATNVTKDEMETALTQTFASQFNVSASAVNVSAAESRRLAQAALRKLAGAWTITFTIKVAENQKESMDAKVSAVLGNATTLKATLGDELVKAGASQSAADSIQAFTVTLVLVTTTGTTTTMDANATTTQLEVVPSSSPLQGTAFLSIILLSTTMVTFSGM